MNKLNLPDTNINQLIDILKERRITITRGDDRMIWNKAKSGEYNVKEGYNYLNNNQLLHKTNLSIALC